MKTRYSALLLFPLLAAWGAPSAAQDIGRVSPASLPLPMPPGAPVPPDVVRHQNPWTLAMTGSWRFQLTHGQMVAGGQFVPASISMNGISASSNEDRNPPPNAFDGNPTTRWCASDDSFPQWIQADLGKVTRVAGVTLSWERPAEHYRCRVEGSADGKRWNTLADESAAPGILSGPVSMQPADVRYVRVVVLGSSNGGWASLWEVQIHQRVNGQDVVWKPASHKATPALGLAHLNDFAGLHYNDSTWDTIPVPSNWEVLGYSLPTYNAVDNTVGLYRRWVTVPASWTGRRTYWHFDGALDGAEVFINGQRAGYHESGYTAWNIDLTGLVHPGQRNLFAVRVCKSVPSSDCETGDFQCMGGIYRETFLVSVPQAHIADVTIRTPLSPDYRDAALDTDVKVVGAEPGEMIVVLGQLYDETGHPTSVKLGADVHADSNGAATLRLLALVKGAKLWSAEKPDLYYVVYQLHAGGATGERVEQRFGFRQIEIKKNIVLWNGRPIKCTGTCRHDFWADKGFALTDKEWSRDLDLMKAANVNAIRTSHYNHAARFLELCEEKGMYILDEVPFCWIGDQVKDPKYAPYLLQRAAETLARDKNRPCVLAWSIGNENPVGVDSQMVMDLVKKTDPTRPAFVSCTSPDAVKGQAWEDDHYPDPSAVDRIANDPRWGANFSEHPHIFYQKETQDYDPGASDLWSEALQKTWDKLWKDPTILGSFIWEWQNQGIADKNPNRTRDFWYGPNHLRQENNKGIVTAYRVPKPEWWIVKMVYSPVVVGARTVNPAGGSCVVPLTNHYSFTDFKELTCKWSAYGGNKLLRSGVTRVACAPMRSVHASFPAPAGMTRLHLEFDHPSGGSITSANLLVEGTPLPPPPPALAPGTIMTVQDAAETLTVSNSLQSLTFNKQTGAIQSWVVNGRTLVDGGPILNLGEGKAGNDRGVYHAPQPPVLESPQVTAAPGSSGDVRVTVTSGVLRTPGGSTLGTLTCSYDVKSDAEVMVNWKLDWTAPDISLWEEGLKLEVPASLAKMTWQRDSFFTDYPPGHMGEPSGSCYPGDVLFRASKRNLHWMTLTNSAGAGVALLAADSPLVARANPGASGNLLFASSGVAGPRDFSGSWVSDHDIHARRGQALSGAFVLRAIG